MPCLILKIVIFSFRLRSIGISLVSTFRDSVDIVLKAPVILSMTFLCRATISFIIDLTFRAFMGVVGVYISSVFGVCFLAVKTYWIVFLSTFVFDIFFFRACFVYFIIVTVLFGMPIFQTVVAFAEVDM